MTRPTIFLVRMVVFLVAVGGVAALLSPVLIRAFDNNPELNSLILFILALGIAWNLRQVLRLTPEVTWLETFQQRARASRRRCRRRSCWRRWRRCSPRASSTRAANRAASPCPPPRCAVCWTASPRGWTRAASCRAT